MKARLFYSLITIFLSMSIFGQKSVNYDENKIAPYVLPKLLILSDGAKIQNIEDWEEKKRIELLDLFNNEVYGKLPQVKLEPTIEVIEESSSALNNTAIRKQVALVFTSQGKEITINILLYIPKGIESPPTFVGYNFMGNQITIDDPKVILTNSWVRQSSNFGINANRATEESRGKRNNRWPIRKILAEGYGIATIYYGDVDPDNNDYSDGIHPLFYRDGELRPKDDEWGAISAWAWGLSRVMDYFEQDHLVEKSKFILFGHSRLGKTALWAGALDERYDIVISNESGCGGAALFRREIGESIAVINRSFPHWFNSNFKKYNDKADLLPIDQHMLIALIAPRPVYIASAEEDRWADPKGEYLSAFHASPVYELYGKKGLSDSKFPDTNQPIHNTIGYHIRTGSHDVTDYDWEQFIFFAKKHLPE